MNDPDDMIYACKRCGCVYGVTRYSLNKNRSYCVACLEDIAIQKAEDKYQERKENRV